MDEYLSEKEQIEQIRKWWSENGRFVVTGLIVGLGLLFGWRYWNNFIDTRASNASLTYERLLGAVNEQNATLALELGGVMERDYARTPYMAQSALALAKLHVDAGEAEQAAVALQRALDTSRDEELTHVARLRLARVRLDQERAQQALEVLGDTNPGRFAPLYHEVRGDVLVVLGDTEAARREYQAALDQFEQGLTDRALLEMKLSDLPSTAEATAAAETDS